MSLFALQFSRINRAINSVWGRKGEGELQSHADTVTIYTLQGSVPEKFPSSQFAVSPEKNQDQI